MFNVIIKKYLGSNMINFIIIYNAIGIIYWKITFPILYLIKNVGIINISNASNIFLTIINSLLIKSINQLVNCICISLYNKLV